MAPPESTAINVNTGWTGRYFDNDTAPTRGWGIATELGVGTTLRPERDPFVRTFARWLYFQPLGTATGSTDPPLADHRYVSSTPALASTFVNTQVVNSSVNPGYVAGSDENGGS